MNLCCQQQLISCRLNSERQLSASSGPPSGMLCLCAGMLPQRGCKDAKKALACADQVNGCRLESVVLVLDNNLEDDPLDNEDQMAEQMESLPYPCRFQYDKTSEYLCTLLDPLAASYAKGLVPGEILQAAASSLSNPALSHILDSSRGAQA